MDVALDHVHHKKYSGIPVQKNEPLKTSIAFFDFDGTITTRDSFLELIKFYRGKPLFYAGFLLHLPFLLAYKLRIISNQAAKERILQFFFSGTRETDFRSRCNDYASTALPHIIRPKAMQEITALQAAGTEIVIVSASAEDWIQAWCNTHNLLLEGTRLEVIDGKITGRIVGSNCHGSEKVRRIRERFRLEDYDEILAFGDTAGDRPMLSLANTRFYKPFR